MKLKLFEKIWDFLTKNMTENETFREKYEWKWDFFQNVNKNETFWEKYEWKLNLEKKYESKWNLEKNMNEAETFREKTWMKMRLFARFMNHCDARYVRHKVLASLHLYWKISYIWLELLPNPHCHTAWWMISVTRISFNCLQIKRRKLAVKKFFFVYPSPLWS